jgi:hypothetical protein
MMSAGEGLLKGAASVVLFVIVGVVCAGSAFADSAPRSLEVQEYRKDFDVSATEARETLDTQEVGAEADIAGSLEANLGPRYAGVWFDNDSGEFVVPVLGAVGREKASDQFDSIDLGGSYRTVHVDSSWPQLETAQESLDRALSRYMKEGLVQTSIDPRTNAVVVKVAEGIGKDDASRVRELARLAGAGVEVRTADTASLRQAPVSSPCEFQVGDAWCNTPIRGGLYIHVSHSPVPGCTSGFNARGKSGESRFVVTAGHCARGETNFNFWEADNIEREEKYLGVIESAYLGGGHDVASIKVNGTYWDANPLPSTIVEVNSGRAGREVPDESEHAITSEASSFVGQYACHTGTATSTTCGYVRAMDVTNTWEEENGEIVFTSHMSELFPVCVNSGDSGGPVFADDAALGITSAASILEDPECARDILYSEITEDTDLLGVTVAPRTSNHSSATVDNPTSGLQALTDGDGAIHVLYRDTKGELGHRWLVKGSETWSAETRPVSSMAGDPKVLIDTSAVFHVFYRETSGKLGHQWIPKGGSGWSGTSEGGSMAGEPSAILGPDGAIHVFYRDTSGNLVHRWLPKGSETWSSESRSASMAGDPKALLDGSGVLHVFYRETSGKLGHQWIPPGGKWSGLSESASLAGDPHVLVDSAGTIHVFYRETSGNLGHRWLPKGSETWGAESRPVSSMAGDPRVVIDTSGVLHVFYRETSGNLGHQWVPPGGKWSGLSESASMAGSPTVVVDQNGAIHVFYRDTKGELGHRWLVKGSETWSAETRPVSSMAGDPKVLIDTSNVLHVFYRETSGNLGHQWIPPGGKWSGVVESASIAARPPLATTGSAGGVEADRATVKATVSPEGSQTNYYFEYGKTTSYGSKAPASPKSAGDAGGSFEVSEALSGLSPSTTYHYRVVATSGEGTANGSDATFTTTAASAPLATTKAATGVGASVATLPASVTPRGASTTYLFEYGKTTSYGQSTSSAGAGSGSEAVEVSQAVSGLAAETTFHYRVKATNSQGTAYGEDATFTTTRNLAAQLAGMAVSEPFDGGTSSLANFSSNWSALGWATGTAKGEDTSTGWRPVNAFSTVNGAYRTASISDSGNGIATVVTLGTSPGSSERYFSLWLDATGSSATRTGYELRFTYTGTNLYTVALSKWETGTKTALASQANVSFAVGSSLALLDEGTAVSAWTDTGSGFAKLLSASDSAFSSGNAGIEGAGNITRLKNFKVGALLAPIGSPVGRWQLRNANSSGLADVEFNFGSTDLIPVAGDWNGDGIDTPGAYKPSTGEWFLRNSNTGGSAEISFTYGGCCDLLPVVGDWNKDGTDTPGLYKPSTGEWYLRNYNSGGFGEINFNYGGGTGTVPIAGDWNNDGTDTIGTYKPSSNSEWKLRNTNSTGSADISFTYGGPEMAPVVGDWNKDGTDTPGLYKTNGEWFLRNSNSGGFGEIEYVFGGGTESKPIAGDWNNDGTDSVGAVR